jgi:hypothetical protein
MRLDESTFLQYAMKHYDNPHCHDISEFEEDLKRFQYIRKLFNRYSSDDDLKERLILNHIIIIYNTFGKSATDMLFFKMKDYHECLKPFIDFLNYLPEKVEYEGIVIHTNDIESNEKIVSKLKEI